MPQAERWREVEALMTLAWRSLKELPVDEVERRLPYDREQQDRADAVMLARLRRYQ